MRETKSITPPGQWREKPKYKVKHDRRKENLNLYIWLHPRNMAERTQNKNTLALAEKIRFEREQAFLEDRAGYRLKKERQNNFLEYFKEKCESERFQKQLNDGLDENERYSSEQIIDALAGMDYNVVRGTGYLPAYSATQLRSRCCATANLPIDRQIILKRKMSQYLKNLKNVKILIIKIC